MSDTKLEMKYFITFEVGNHPTFLGSKSEHTWISTNDTLEKVLRDIEKNNHKVIRVVYGHELEFKTRIEIIKSGFAKIGEDIGSLKMPLPKSNIPGV